MMVGHWKFSDQKWYSSEHILLWSEIMSSQNTLRKFAFHTQHENFKGKMLEQVLQMLNKNSSAYTMS